MTHLRNGLAAAVLAGSVLTVQAQTPPAHAFRNVTVHQADGTVITNASIVWRNGIIEAVGRGITIPFDARVTDGGDSLHVYPGLIDGLGDWGTPDLPRTFERAPDPGNPTYERAGIQPERDVRPLLKADAPEFTALRANGFTLASIAPKGFMLPGRASVFHVKGNQTAQSEYRTGVGVKASMTGARGAYPSTPMGVLARYRQLFWDSEALQTHQAGYAANPGGYSLPGRDPVLESLFAVRDKSMPFHFVLDTRAEIMRAIRLSDELGFRFVIVSGKEAHTVADELKRRNIPVLASFDVPDKPKWMTQPADSTKTLTEEETAWRERQQEAWTASVRNVRTLIDAGVTVGFASNGLKPADFGKKYTLLTAEGGLTADDLVRVMTANTAGILGIGSHAGDLRVGRLADLMVTTGTFAGTDTRVAYTVTAGETTEHAATGGANRRRMNR